MQPVQGSATHAGTSCRHPHVCAAMLQACFRCSTLTHTARLSQHYTMDCGYCSATAVEIDACIMILWYCCLTLHHRPLITHVDGC